MKECLILFYFDREEALAGVRRVSRGTAKAAFRKFNLLMALMPFIDYILFNTSFNSFIPERIFTLGGSVFG